MPEIRRATEAEIATAHAWVEHYTADWNTEAPDFESAKQGEYEHALEVLIFANGGRHTEPIDWNKVLRERDSLARRCAARFEEIEKLRARFSVYGIAQAIATHYDQCKRPHPTNADWFTCEAQAIANTPAP